MVFGTVAFAWGDVYLAVLAECGLAVIAELKHRLVCAFAVVT